MAATLYRKVFDLHTVRKLPTGQTQLFIGLHLVHEVTSPQAFDMIRRRGGRVPFPDRTVATVDHIVPTDGSPRPFANGEAEAMLAALERNCREYGIRFFPLGADGQGIVHVIGPELGLTQPGMTIACGDSHTSTHGAFGAIAFGIGTSQVRDVLATQTLAVEPLKVRRIEVAGSLGPGVYAKDVILGILGRLGVKAGAGFAYEFGGALVTAMSMDERMTLCNMSIEGGARVGYVNPDATTFDDLKGRPFAPKGDAFERATRWWASLASDPGAPYDDAVRLDGRALEPMVTWGINPGQVAPVSGRVPVPSEESPEARASLVEALEYMGLEGGRPLAGIPVDVAFIGSCTNGRLSDLREAAKVAKGRRVARGVRALVVPGSNAVKKAAEKEGLHEVFREAGFEWREAGCSMCLAMNPDRLVGRETCASSSNRNFKGRQGSPTGRTLLMSPAMVAAAAIAGEVADVRTMLR
ncbi:MAG TPA: 3-isopropylmalate dehydratase large subunit [Thermoanaerobaculia bacterium]|nr:3-isopropylmalate dehydratase large subunit [Thermoanaerobaculia bacterium]